MRGTRCRKSNYSQASDREWRPVSRRQNGNHGLFANTDADLHLYRYLHRDLYSDTDLHSFANSHLNLHPYSNRYIYRYAGPNVHPSAD